MSTRVLCMGNELMADDALGLVVAEKIRRLCPRLEVISCPAGGLDLLDYTMGASRLIVVDTIDIDTEKPGTVLVFAREDLNSHFGGSLHSIGLFEVLRLGEGLDLPVPKEVIIIAVVPADCRTVGGAMDEAVRDSIPEVLSLIRSMAGERALEEA